MDQELVSYLDRRFEETKRGITEETARQIGAVREELRTEIREQVRAVHEDLRAEMGTMREDLRTEFRTEIRQLGVTVEGLRTQIQTVAEGVMVTNERLDRFENRVEAQFDEVKSMIKFSYAELDRRMTQIEARTKSLEARVDRIEAART